MITKKEYLLAKKIVEEYQREEFKMTLNFPRVKLSDYGKTMQNPHNKMGIIVGKRLAGMTDYNVEVLWEDGKKEDMHESQVKYL